VLDRRLLDPHRDHVPSSNLADPFIDLECSKRLCNSLVERLRRHLQGMLVTVRVFARYRAGPHSHIGIFSSFVRSNASTDGRGPNCDFCD